MNIQSILVLAGAGRIFVLAIAWISKNGGWQGGGCGGDCSHCASHCDDPEKRPKGKIKPKSRRGLPCFGRRLACFMEKSPAGRAGMKLPIKCCILR